MIKLFSNEIVKHEECGKMPWIVTHGHLSRASWHCIKHTLKKCFQWVLLLLAAASGYCRDSAARRAKLMGCCFGKLNDLNQTELHCSVILENAMTLTALLPANLCSSGENKISPNPENHVSQSISDPLGSLFKGVSMWMQLQCSERCPRLRMYQVDALCPYQISMFYRTGKQVCKIQYIFVISPTQTYRLFLITAFLKATS